MIRTRHARLVVIGGPSGSEGEVEMQRLTKLACDLGVPGRITFIPPLPREQLVAFYQAADVVIMPSRSETFGLVAAEAQSCGTPVVAANVGGLRFIIEDGKSGLLVAGHNPADYAAALDRVLTDTGLATKLSAGALEHSQRFSWETTVSRLLELYEGIAESRR
jgi:D-inositol-3-phosphate glycosyltransferase